ncbi:Rdx family-domain-containing protein [Xylaria arbuscula]|nr:Rdx family-domain-containing protein [Xylaria arbuscula]
MAETEEDKRPASASVCQSPASPSALPLPRVTIRFCTQCKWMLRAAYFAQELLSTFSTSLGEVALQPATGGVFVVEIHYAADPSAATGTDNDDNNINGPATQRRVLWDRKTDGGFPETKELKRRVRDVIEPGRNLGHVDRDYPRQQQQKQEERKGDEPGLPPQPGSQTAQGECEDCR